MVLPWVGSFSGWVAVTNLGQSDLLLPLGACFGVVLTLRVPTRSLGVCWLALLFGAASLVALTKMAFIGWGIGSAAWDFTGVSGHAMCAAAIYPLLFALAFGGASRWPQRLAVAAGFLVALLIAVSRLKVHAHSPSEVLSGALLGAAVSLWALRGRPLPRAQWPAIAVLSLFALLLPRHDGETVVSATEVDPHDVLTRLALQASGHSRPHVRSELHRRVGVGPLGRTSSTQRAPPLPTPLRLAPAAVDAPKTAAAHPPHTALELHAL